MKIDLGALEALASECEGGGGLMPLFTLHQAKALLALARYCVEADALRRIAWSSKSTDDATEFSRRLNANSAAYPAALAPFLPYAKEEARSAP